MNLNLFLFLGDSRNNTQPKKKGGGSHFPFVFCFWILIVPMSENELRRGRTDQTGPAKIKGE